MEGVRHVQCTQNRKLIIFLQYIKKKVSQWLLCSILMQNIQIFTGVQSWLLLLVHSKIIWSYFGFNISCRGRLNGQTVIHSGTKNESVRSEIEMLFASATLNLVPYPQVNTIQTKCMKYTSTKIFDKFPAPTSALQVVLRTRKVSFTDHSRPNTINLLYYYLFIIIYRFIHAPLCSFDWYKDYSGQTTQAIYEQYSM